MESASKKRRITVACDECSRRRRKCEGGLPACASCVTHGRAAKCSYTKPIRKRGPQAGYTAIAKSSSHRVSLLEMLLGDIFLLYPAISELCEVSLNRLDTCSLLPHSASVPPRSDEDKKQAWASSRTQAIVDEMIAQQEEEAEDPQGDAPRTSTSGATPHTTVGRTRPPPRSASIPTPVFDSYQYLPPTPSTSNFSPTFGLADLATAAQSHQRQPPLSTSLPTLAVPVHFGPSSNTSIFTASSSPPNQLYLVSAPPEVSSPFLNDPLPSEPIVSVLLDTYFNGGAHASLPIVDKQHISIWATQNQSSNSSDEDIKPSTITISHELLYAMFAVALPHSPIAGDSNWSITDFKYRSEAFLNRAKSTPNLETVQSHVLLAFVDLGLGDLFSAGAHLAIAVSHAYTLGYADSSSTCYEANEKDDITRRTFWSLIVVDVLLALRIGRVPTIPTSSYENHLPSVDGSEETEPWRPSQHPAASNSSIDIYTPSSALSTFIELVRLCLIGSKHLTRLNAPCDAVILSSEAVPPLSTTSQSLFRWEQALPSHIGFQPRGQNIAPHKVELLLLYRTFMILCTRPRSPAFQLDSDCVNHLLAGLDTLSQHVERTSLVYSRPPLESCIATFASTLVFLSPTSATPESSVANWRTVIEAATCLSALFPSSQKLLETIRGLPNARSLVPPSSNILHGSWLNAELHKHISGPGSIHSSSPDTSMDAISEGGRGGSSSGANGVLPDEWSKILDTEMQPATTTSTRSELGSNLLAEFDFSSWTDSNEVLRCLGFRGATRPSSPVPGQDQPLDVDLFGRWTSQGDIGDAEGEWTWAQG